MVRDRDRFLLLICLVDHFRPTSSLHGEGKKSLVLSIDLRLTPRCTEPSYSYRCWGSSPFTAYPSAAERRCPTTKQESKHIRALRATFILRRPTRWRRYTLPIVLEEDIRDREVSNRDGSDGSAFREQRSGEPTTPSASPTRHPTVQRPTTHMARDDPESRQWISTTCLYNKPEGGGDPWMCTSDIAGRVAATAPLLVGSDRGNREYRRLRASYTRLFGSLHGKDGLGTTMIILTPVASVRLERRKTNNLDAGSANTGQHSAILLPQCCT